MHFKSIIIAITAILLSLGVAAQGNKDNKSRVNAGLKIGFHAATYNNTDFCIDGYEYDNSIIQSNKIGYSVTPFIKVNYKRLYIQTEANLSLSRHYFEFIETNSNENETPMYTENSKTPEYKLTTYCIQVPLLLGYNFVESYPYTMSVFTGPKAKFVFTAHDKQEFMHFKYNYLREQLEPILYYWEIGLGVTISRFCFDFVYDVGLSNNAKGILSPNEGKKFKSKRSDNLLSFSIGIIF